MKFYMKATPFLLTLSLLIILDLIICYVVSVSMGHVYPLVPFISETGNHPPESCIFTVITSLCSLCMVLCIWFRYQQVGNYVRQLKHGGRQLNLLVINKIGYLIGIFTAMNLFGVAHFQEVNMDILHAILAGSFFVGSALLLHIQSSISGQITLCTPFIARLRHRQALLQPILVFFTMCNVAVALLQLNGKNIRDLTPADNGYLCHTVSAICEYAALLNLALYLLTFYEETLHMSIEFPEVYLDGHPIHDIPSEEDLIKSAIWHMLSKVIGINC